MDIDPDLDYISTQRCRLTIGGWRIVFGTETDNPDDYWGVNVYIATNVLVAFLMAFAATVSFADAKTVRQSKSAKSGQTQWMDAFFGWNDDCSFKTINVDIVERPEHGSVSPRVETQKITQAQVGSAGKCLGQRTKAVAIYYKSKSGYRGRDNFKVRMRVGGQSPVFFVYRVNVR